MNLSIFTRKPSRNFRIDELMSSTNPSISKSLVRVWRSTNDLSVLTTFGMALVSRAGVKYHVQWLSPSPWCPL
jgi:hypothetical protein